jgi:hypothetical protein
MNLSIVQAGPGSQISGDVSLILEALLKIINNNNEQQGKSFEMKLTATNSESDAIIQSAKDQGDSMYTQGMFSMTGAITSGVMMAGMQGKAMYEQSGVNSLNEQIEGVNSFSGKLTTVSPRAVSAAVTEDAVSTPMTPDTHKFLNGTTKESGGVFNKGELSQADYERKLDTLATEAQANQPQAQKRAEDLHAELKVRRDVQQNKVQQASQSASSLSQGTSGLLTGIGSMSASSSTAAQGQQEAIKMCMNLMIEFAKGIEQTTSSNISAATQQQSQVLQNMDAVVYQANASRG